MDMRKIWRGFAAAAAGAAALLSLSGCAVGQPETAMDTYHYDGYLNAQWGSAPDEVANQLQLDRTQWVRLEEDQLAGMPEGTFGYAITRTTMMFGLYMDTEMYFAPSLEGVGDYIGLYAMKITFHEDPAYYATSDLSLCDEDFKLNGDDAIEEFQARAMYNRNVEYGSYTDQYGDWDTITWYCDATIDSVSVDDETRAAAKENLGALDSGLSMWGEYFNGVSGMPLSSATIYYNNPSVPSYILFSGLPAAVLSDVESAGEDA